MKMKKYKTEIKVEPGPNDDYPIVLSYHYARGMSPWELTIKEAEELLHELESTIKKVRHQTPKIKRIPISHVQKGIEYCIVNALAYLDDARMILSKRRSGHAYVSVQLAIEELGKIILLKERRDKASKKIDEWEVSIKVKEEWKNHKYKAQKAWNMLDPNIKVIHTHIPRLEKDDTLASHLTRLECAYVDFHEKSQSWRLGPVIDKQKLEMLIENVERVLNVARKS